MQNQSTNLQDLSLVAQFVKNLWETLVWSLGWEDPLEKGKATYSSILAWRTPCTVYSMGHKELDTTEWLSLVKKLSLSLPQLTSSQAPPGSFCDETKEQVVPPSPDRHVAASLAQRTPSVGWWLGSALWGVPSCSFSGNVTMDTESQASSFGELSLSRASKMGWSGSFKYLKNWKP